MIVNRAGLVKYTVLSPASRMGGVRAEVHRGLGSLLEKFILLSSLRRWCWPSHLAGRAGITCELFIYVLISLSRDKGAVSRPGPPSVGEVDAQARRV